MKNLINKINNFKQFIILLSKSKCINYKKLTPNHNLNKKLTVSMSVKFERLKFFKLTLISIFNQTIMPDEILLWIENKHKSRVPKSILNFRKYGLKIKFCKNYRSYNKIIHTLKIRKNNYIITFDDDIYYHKKSIEYLIKKSIKFNKCVVSNRMHKIITKNKLPVQYRDWIWNSTNRKISKFNFLTGVYGVLYPPKSFFKDVLKNKIFTKLCPTADDIWLYWMLRLNKKYVVWSGFRNRNIDILNFDFKDLKKQNISEGNNDKQILKLINYYKFP